MNSTMPAHRFFPIAASPDPDFAVEPKLSVVVTGNERASGEASGAVWCGGVVSWKRVWSGISVSGERIERAKRTQWRPSVRSYLTRMRPLGLRPGRRPAEDECASKVRTWWLWPSENVPSPPETTVRELASGPRSAAQARPRSGKMSLILPGREKRRPRALFSRDRRKPH